MKEPDNPPAFPITPEQYFEGKKAIGMTLLDYFAAKAMQGMIANGITIDIDKDIPFETRAGVAYLIAKAMLKERQKHL